MTKHSALTFLPPPMAWHNNMAAEELQHFGAQLSARLDRLPAARPVWLVIAALALGGWFEVFDVFLTAYIGPGMVKEGIFTHGGQHFFDLGSLGAFVAAMFFGVFIGTFLVASVADRFGRRRIFVVALMLYALAGAIMAFQHDAGWIVFWRIITGIGVGAELVTIDAYVSEFIPARLRGRSYAFVQAIQYTSIPTIAFLSWQLVPLAPMGITGWRWVVLFGSLGAIVVWIIRIGLPESPRWLVQQGRYQEAEDIVRRLEARVIVSTGKPLPPVAETTAAVPAVAGPAVANEMWRPPYRRRTIMLLVFNFFQSIGYYGFASWIPTLLAAKGVTFTHSLFYSFLIAFASPLGPLLAMLFADRIERKWLVSGAALAMACIGTLFSWQSQPVMLVAMGLLLSLASTCMTFSYRTYQAELFPTRIRAKAIGLVYSVSRISAMFSGFTIAYVLHTFGVSAVFAVISAAMAIVVFTIGTFGPKTLGRRLEDISG
ncbi:MFS transporter [Gibbsiella quercinecans]|uniref:MFS transporter n=1 Tax=Gibbsiella quercinecans TaxID=929813 RepID=UPI0024327E31|nr:MFS transporter [Gibbsiella quercinecans]